MIKRLGGAVLVAVAVSAAAVLIPNGVAATTQSPDLVVHEWGTFTSIAGPDGQAVQWRPLTGPSDLPCFVTLLNPDQHQDWPGLVSQQSRRRSGWRRPSSISTRHPSRLSVRASAFRRA